MRRIGGVPRRASDTVILAVLTGAGMAFALQQIVVAPALPSIQDDLNTSATWASWVFSIFFLTSAVATPLMGRLGDQYGKERLLLVSVGLFFVGSVAAVFAWSIASLIASRAIQGLGGAILPLSFAIVRDELPRQRVGLGMAIVSSVFGIAGPAGLLLAGPIIEHLSWRYLFVLGAVGMGIAGIFVRLFIPPSPVRTEASLDLGGASLLSGGLVALLLGLSQGSSWGWGSPPVLVLFAAGLFLLAVWARFELRVAQPMVDVRVLVRREVLATNVSCFFVGWAAFGVLLLIPPFVQAPHNLPDEVAGLVDYGFHASGSVVALYLLPSTLVQIVTAPLAGVLGRRFGARLPFVAGTVVMLWGYVQLALWNDEPWQVLFALLFVGSGIGLSFAAAPKLVTDAVAQGETGVANGINTIMRSVGGVVGGQISIALIATWTYVGTTTATATGFVIGFWACAAAGLAGCLVAFAIRGQAGEP